MTAHFQTSAGHRSSLDFARSGSANTSLATVCIEARRAAGPGYLLVNIISKGRYLLANAVNAGRPPPCCCAATAAPRLQCRGPERQGRCSRQRCLVMMRGILQTLPPAAAYGMAALQCCSSSSPARGTCGCLLALPSPQTFLPQEVPR